jgi:gluconolactonase
VEFPRFDLSLFESASGARPKALLRFSCDKSGIVPDKPEFFAECTEGLFDGFRIDTDDRIWTSARDGVHCYDKDGQMIGKIKIPEIVSNICFGGAKLNRLFITGTTSLYSIYLTINGKAF